MASMSTTLLGVDLQTLPRTIVVDPPLTDAEFEVFCSETDNVQIERTKDGVIKLNPPTAASTGDGNAEITYQLRAWWHTHRQGRVFDSSTGFHLPDTSVLSPDAAYVGPDKLKGLTKADICKGFVHLCPDFVIELLSESDSLLTAQSKMVLWMENGAPLGWLIDPYAHAVYVYQPGESASWFLSKLSAFAGPVEGFTLDLEEVWRCYEV